jgi:serine/threonine protein kinase
MSDHPPPELLAAFLRGELDEQEFARVDAHLNTCQACEEASLAFEASLKNNEVSASNSNRDEETLPDTLASRLSKLREVTAAISRRPQLGTPPLIDGYEIFGELGRGGMGVVVLAWDCSREEVVAIKVVSKDRFQNSDDEARFLSEVAAQRSVSHATVSGSMDRPGTLSVYDFGLCGTDYYLVMPWVKEGSLDQHIAELRSRPLEVASIIEQVARTLHAHHQLQPPLFHRDIKPKNILLSRRERQKAESVEHDTLEWDALIADFGLAKRLGDEARHTEAAILGTPDYMAPEQITQGSSPTPQMEVYSLGATMYESLTGRKPFQFAPLGSHPFDVLVEVRRGHPPLPRRAWPSAPGQTTERVPKPLQAICMKCLEYDPPRRYQSAQELADDLERYRLGRKVLAHIPAPQRRAWWWCRRHPRIAAALTLVSFVFALMLVILALETRRAIDLGAQNAALADRALRLNEQRESLLRTNFLSSLSNAKANFALKAPLPDILKELNICFALCDRLILEHPDKPQYQAIRHITETVTGKITFDSARNDADFADALSWYDKSIDGLTRLYRRFPGGSVPKLNDVEVLAQVQGFRTAPQRSLTSHLAEVLQYKAVLFHRQRRYTEGLISIDEAATFSDASNKGSITILQFELANQAAREQATLPWSKGPSADHSKAIRLARYLAERAGTSPPAVYNAACAFALASQDASANSEERNKRGEYAVSLLRRIAGKGYFLSEKKTHDLETDHDLDAIRERADFKQFVASLTK